jgi:hypothetical protein
MNHGAITAGGFAEYTTAISVINHVGCGGQQWHQFGDNVVGVLTNGTGIDVLGGILPE